MLEIGPGPGGLTRALLAEGARHVVAIERDARCLPALAEIAAAWPGRLTVLEGDALALDPLPHLTPPVRVVANLPYNVGTELLVRWLTPASWPPFWTSLTLMFQKEVAERIVARPGSKAYGRLAILAQWRAEPRIAFEIPPRAFTPPPKVTSAVVQIDRLEAPRFPADAAVLSRVVALAFGQRRKMLRASLKPLGPDVEALLEEAGIAPTDRAEQVPLEALLPAQPDRRRVANAIRRLGRLDRALVARLLRRLGVGLRPAPRARPLGRRGLLCLRLRVGLVRLRRRMGAAVERVGLRCRGGQHRRGRLGRGAAALGRLDRARAAAFRGLDRPGEIVGIVRVDHRQPGAAAGIIGCRRWLSKPPSSRWPPSSRSGWLNRFSCCWRWASPSSRL